MKAEDFLLLNELKNEYEKTAKDFRQNRRMPIEDDTIKIKELIIRTDDGEFSLFDDEIDVMAVKKMVNVRADKWEERENNLRKYMEEIKIEYPDELLEYIKQHNN